MSQQFFKSSQSILSFIPRFQTSHVVIESIIQHNLYVERYESRYQLPTIPHLAFLASRAISHQAFLVLN